MSLNLPEGINVLTAKPADFKQGPYTDLAAACAAIVVGARGDGLTVKIIGDSREWWWEANDTSDAGLKVKIDLSAVGGIPEFILYPGIDSGNIYGSWATLYTALSSLPVTALPTKKRIILYLDSDYTVPAGSYDLSGTEITTAVQVLTQYKLKLAANCSIYGLERISGKTYITSDWTSGGFPTDYHIILQNDLIMQEFAKIGNTASAVEIFRVNGGNSINLYLYGRSEILPTYPCIGIRDNNTTLNVELFDASSLGASAIRIATGHTGTAYLNIDVCNSGVTYSEVQLPVPTVTLKDKAKNVDIDDIPTMAATQVQQALEELRGVQKVYIFSPAGVASGNVYTSFPLLYADLIAYGGIKKVLVNSSGSSAVTIPAKSGGGVWDFTNTELSTDTSESALCQVILATNCLISNLKVVSGYVALNSSSSTNTAGHIQANYGSMIFKGNATPGNLFPRSPVFMVPTGNTFIINLYENASLGRANYDTFEIDGTSKLLINLYDETAVGYSGIINAGPNSGTKTLIFNVWSLASLTINTTQGVTPVVNLKNKFGRLDRPANIASGTNTYSVSLTPPIIDYISGQFYTVLFTNGNTGAATLNVNLKGARTLVKNGSVALAGGEITAGTAYLLYDDGTNLQVVSVAPAATVINITNAALLTAIGASGLTPFAYYNVTNPQDGGSIIMQALTSNKLNQIEGIWARPTNLKAWGYFIIASGSSGSITSVIVNGVTLNSSTIAYSSTRIGTATNLVNNINARTGTSGYRAVIIQSPNDIPYIVIEKVVADTTTSTITVNQTGMVITNSRTLQGGIIPVTENYIVSYNITSDRVIKCYDPIRDISLKTSLSSISVYGGGNPINGFQWGSSSYSKMTIGDVNFKDFFNTATDSISASIDDTTYFTQCVGAFSIKNCNIGSNNAFNQVVGILTVPSMKNNNQFLGCLFTTSINSFSIGNYNYFNGCTFTSALQAYIGDQNSFSNVTINCDFAASTLQRNSFTNSTILGTLNGSMVEYCTMTSNIQNFNIIGATLRFCTFSNSAGTSGTLKGFNIFWENVVINLFAPVGTLTIDVSRSQWSHVTLANFAPTSNLYFWDSQWIIDNYRVKIDMGDLAGGIPVDGSTGYGEAGTTLDITNYKIDLPPNFVSTGTLLAGNGLSYDAGTKLRGGDSTTDNRFFADILLSALPDNAVVAGTVNGTVKRTTAQRIQFLPTVGNWNSGNLKIWLEGKIVKFNY